MSDTQQVRDRATRLYALALKARDNNLDDYAVQLEELAAEAARHADQLSQQQSKRSPPRTTK